MRTSETITEIAAALATAQSEITSVKADAKNPYYKSEYSTLAACNKAVRKPLAANGISVIQSPDFRNDNGSREFVLLTRLQHQSGEFIESELSQPVGELSPQALGSLISYFRRYGLCAMVGLATEGEDDDGNQANEATPPKKTKKPKKAAPRPATLDQIERLDELGKQTPFDSYEHFHEFVVVGFEKTPGALDSEQARKLTDFIETKPDPESWPEKQKTAFDLARLNCAKKEGAAV